MIQKVGKQDKQIGIARQRRRGALMCGGPSGDMAPDPDSKSGQRIRDIAQTVCPHQNCVHRFADQIM